MRSSVLQDLMALNLSTEQLAGVVTIMARELAPLERIRLSAAQRQAKKRDVSTSRDNNANSSANNAANSNGLARIVDINTTSNQDRYNPPFPPSKPKRDRNADPEGFVEFWAVYPIRDGERDRKTAVKAFRAALRRVDFQTLLAAAKAYRAEMERKGKIGTEFVKQARTWLNSDPWTEVPAQTQKTGPMPFTVIREGTPEWEALKAKNPRIQPRDIKTPSGIVRGAYHYGEAA